MTNLVKQLNYKAVNDYDTIPTWNAYIKCKPTFAYLERLTTHLSCFSLDNGGLFAMPKRVMLGPAQSLF